MPDRAERMEKDDDRKSNSDEPGSSIDAPSRERQDDRGFPIEGSESSDRERQRNITMASLAGASPPTFVSLEDIMKAATGMRNMALAHEIAVDKNFILQKLESDDDNDDHTLHRKVKEIMHKAFWNLLAKQLEEDPPEYEQALKLLKEIKESLDELVLPHHTKIRENIKEVLDVDLIRQQAERGVLDFHHYARYIISIMSKVCAPVRDDKIKELQQRTDVIETFKGIMETLQLMRLDLANFTITMMRPNIVASSIEYEKAKFAEFLKIQTDGLRYTRQWLLRHLDEERAAVTATDANAVKQITHRLLAEAYLDLLEWDFNPDAETLLLDQGRLIELRDKTSRLSIVGSVILLVNNTVGAPVQGVSNLKKKLKEHLAALLDAVHSNKELEEAMPSIVLQVRADVKATLEEIGAPELSQALETILEGQLLDIVKPDHKIRHLVGLRIRQFLQKIILSQSTAPQQTPPGLSSLQEELAAIAAQFLILVAHNRSVFGEYYQEIVAKAMTDGETTSAVNMDSA